MRHAPTGALVIRCCGSPWGVVAAIVSALVIAACGSASKPHAATGASGAAPGIKFADCMRSHGVPSFPDASAGGGFHLPSTINTQSPAYLSARQACTKPPASAASRRPSGRQQRVLIAAAKCMRAHGIKVADPTFNGAYMTLDELNQTTIASPAFKRAEPICHYPVPNNASSPVSP